MRLWYSGSRFLKAGLLGIALCVAAGLQAEPSAQRMIPDAVAAPWLAVGRLHVAGNRYCTATLISPDEVITSAHCLFHSVTLHRAPPSEIRFVAGLRRDAYAALAGVSATAILPDDVYTGIEVTLDDNLIDLALLKLNRAITSEEALPLAVVDWPAGQGPFDIVGYGRDRPLIPSIREGCTLLAEGGPFRELDCPVVPGLSGAPVVMSGGQDLVAVVSTSVGTRVQGVSSVVIPVAPFLAELRSILDEGGN